MGVVKGPGGGGIRGQPGNCAAQSATWVPPMRGADRRCLEGGNTMGAAGRSSAGHASSTSAYAASVWRGLSQTTCQFVVLYSSIERLGGQKLSGEVALGLEMVLGDGSEKWLWMALGLGRMGSERDGSKH